MTNQKPMTMAQMFRSKLSEHVIQLECIAWFRNEFERKKLGIIIPVVNEATYNNKTQVIKEGASDTIVFFPKIALFVEMKTATGRQRDAQEAFEADVRALGYKYYLCRSLSAFKAIIHENI